MFRVLFRVALVGSLIVAWPGCGGGSAVTKTVQQDPKRKEAKQLVTDARAQAGAGRIDDADRSYGEAYTTASESPNLAWDILVEWVDFLGNAGRHGRARDVAKQYFEATNQSEPKAYQLYAEALIRGGRGQEALDIATSLVGLTGDDPIAHDKRGRALLLVDRLDEAVEELRKAVQLDPNNAKYHLSLGEALHKLGDIDKAALEFRAALKNAPDDPTAHVLLGMALRDQGELDESKTYLDKAIVLDPKNGRAYFELGLLYNKQTKNTEAQEAFGKAVKYSPNDSRFWYAYGEIFRVQDRLEDAIAAYRKAVDLDPPFPKAVAKLGSALVDRKSYDEAERFLIQAIRREPKNAANYLTLGRAYAAMHKTRQAIDNYESFLKFAPKNDPERDHVRDVINQLKRR
jgi:superkiller protein 3